MKEGIFGISTDLFFWTKKTSYNSCVWLIHSNTGNMKQLFIYKSKWINSPTIHHLYPPVPFSTHWRKKSRRFWHGRADVGFKKNNDLKVQQLKFCWLNLSYGRLSLIWCCSLKGDVCNCAPLVAQNRTAISEQPVEP